MKKILRILLLIIGIFLVFLGAPEYAKFTTSGLAIGVPLMMIGLFMVAIFGM